MYTLVTYFWRDQAALSLLMMDEDNDSQHFSLKSIQQREKLEKKRRKKKTKQQLIADKAVEDTFKARNVHKNASAEEQACVVETQVSWMLFNGALSFAVVLLHLGLYSPPIQAYGAVGGGG